MTDEITFEHAQKCRLMGPQVLEVYVDNGMTWTEFINLVVFQYALQRSKEEELGFA